MFLLFAVSIVTFVLFFLMPGDPSGQRAQAGDTQVGEGALREHMGSTSRSGCSTQGLPARPGPDRRRHPSGVLNWPPNLGYWFDQEPVLNIILDRLPSVISLAIGSAMLWLLIGIPLGIMAALKPGSFRDRAATTFALFGASAPVFLVGVTLLYFLYFKLRIFPVPKYTPFTESPLLWAQGLFLAWLTVAIGLAALYTRLTRGSMLEVQGEDFVRTAPGQGPG